MKKDQPITVEDLLDPIENAILKIKKRVFYLDATLKEIQQRLGPDVTFDVRNEIVLQLLQDSKDMLVIDLASLYRGMCQAGGFFTKLRHLSGKLQAKHFSKFRAPEPLILNSRSLNLSPEREDALKLELETDTQKMFAEQINNALIDLFPELKLKSHKKADQQNINSLEARFKDLAEKVEIDRDAFRAHRYELLKIKAPAKQIELPELKAEFERLEKLINKIRLIATNSTMTYPNLSFANTERTAEDLVDIAIFGNINEIMNKFGISDRLRQDQGPRYYYQFRENYWSSISTKPGTQPEGQNTI